MTSSSEPASEPASYPEANNNLTSPKEVVMLPRSPSSLEVKLMLCGLGAIVFQLGRFFGAWVALGVLAGFAAFLGGLTFFLLRWMENSETTYEYNFGGEGDEEEDDDYDDQDEDDDEEDEVYEEDKKER